jgi:hypothetical protein
MSIHVQRLLQALENYNTRTKGAEDQPKGVQEAVAALVKALGTPAPGRDTPGQREALKVAPGTVGTGAPMEKAAVGIDGPSPGQREAKSLSQQIHEAAASIVDANKQS